MVFAFIPSVVGALYGGVLLLPLPVPDAAFGSDLESARVRSVWRGQVHHSGSRSTQRGCMAFLDLVPADCVDVLVVVVRGAWRGGHARSGARDR